MADVDTVRGSDTMHEDNNTPIIEDTGLDWANLTFGYNQTDCNIRYTFKGGSWDEGKLVRDQTIPIHVAATCLHYG